MVAALALTAVSLALFASSAAAAECTDIWTGPSGGEWTAPENWSSEQVPSSEDIACVPTGTVAKVESGASTVGALQGAGRVTIEAGSLAITGTEPSNIGTLRLEGGQLKGGGTLFVTSFLVGAGGAMVGTGMTVVGTEASAAINEPETEVAGLRLLGKHTLRNNGEIDVDGPGATLAVLEGSTLENNSELEILGAEATLREVESHIVNAGNLAGEGAEAELRAEAGSVDNEGELQFSPTKSRVLGTDGAGIASSGLIWGGGELWIESGNVSIAEAAEASNIGTLRLDGGLLKGAGTLYVTSSLVGAGGAMQGTGRTVVGAEATASITEPEAEIAGLRLLAKHTLQNNGELHVDGPAATLAILEGSKLENESVLGVLGAEATLREVEGHIVNTGRLVGEGAEVELRAEGGSIENKGQIQFLPAKSRILGAEGVGVENSGELLIDGEGAPYGLVSGSGEGLLLKNLGVLAKGPGEYQDLIGFPLDNRGQVIAHGGEFVFAGGATAGPGEKIWGGAFNEGRILFADGSFELGSSVTLEGKISVLNLATVQAGTYEAWNSEIEDEEGVVELTGTESETIFGRLDLIGANLEVPAGASAGAGFLGLAKGNLTVASGARWTRGYVEQVGGAIEAVSGSEFKAGYIDQVEGDISIKPESSFSVEYMQKQGGSVHVGANATFAPGGWEQLGGSLTVGAGTNFVGESGYWKLRKGSQSFGKGVEPSMYFFGQLGGELSVAHTNRFHVDVWDHEGGVASIAPETAVFLRVFEQSGDVVEFGQDSTVEGFTYMGISKGEVDVGKEATVSGSTTALFGGDLELADSSALVLNENLGLEGGKLLGAGDSHSRSLFLRAGEMGGAGTSTVTERSWIEGEAEELVLNHRNLVTAGEVHFESGALAMGGGATWKSSATFEANSETEVAGGQIHPLEEASPSHALVSNGPDPRIINTGSVEKTKGSGTTTIDVAFENLGEVGEKESHLAFADPAQVPASELFGTQCNCGHPIDAASGNFTEEQTDFDIPGRGLPLALSRSYSAQAAATASAPGAFGYGWTMEYGDKLLLFEPGTVTALLGSGATVPFVESESGTFEAPAWSKESLSGSPESGFTLLFPDQSREFFSGTGALQTSVDRNGNETTLEYNEAGQLQRIIDPSGRAIRLDYDESGFVESAEDPMGHVVKYAYEGGDLSSVTMPGESSPRWTFTYDSNHRMTVEADGRGGETTNEYDSENRTTSQTNPVGRKLTFAYQPFHTTVRNEATGAVTEQWFTSNNEPFSITHGAGTSFATTETFTYDPAGLIASRTDGNGDTTSYGYDTADNRTSERDPEDDETVWTYNAAHQVLSETTPEGETTTVARDASGNPKAISRPAPGGETQTVAYEYGPHGEVESMTDPLGATWTYEYDSQGDLVGETDPEGDKRAWTYNEDSQVTSAVSPRGNAEGAKPGDYTTTVERDPLGRPLEIVDPLGGMTKYAYDADGNVESIIDPNGHQTNFTYDSDERRTEVEKPDGSIEKTAYDGAGAVISQTDGSGSETIYARNVLEQPVETTDALGRTTLRSFDAVGNIRTVTDPDGRITTYGYDKDGRPTSISYSEKATPGATFTYNKDSALLSMTDGTGESTLEYDQLQRLVHSANGAGDQVSWEYDLGNEPVELTYPDGKVISRAFDQDGRLESVTDWLGHTTVFAYSPDSKSVETRFPTSTGDSDVYTYDRADRLSGAAMKKGTEALASLTYERDPAGQLESLVSKGLPGLEEESFSYDENERLVGAGGEVFGYDNAGNLMETPGGSNTFDKDSQLESSAGISFAYDKEGERTSEVPSSGPATGYGYDQAGDLTSVERAEEEGSPGIDESLAYDGLGLLSARTFGGGTDHFVWDLTGSPEPLLSDGQDSFLYGPGGAPFEQISSTEVPEYLHHDQLGSIRLVTDAEGETVGAFSYSPYGAVTGQTGSATTSLGFAGQYELGESGLQYLHARFYDPSTAQFLTRDPAVAITHSPYAYVGGNPTNRRDPSGLEDESLELPSFGGWWSPEAIQGEEEALEAATDEIGDFGNEVGDWIGGLFDHGESESEKLEKQSEEQGECKAEDYEGWKAEKGDPKDQEEEDREFLESLQVPKQLGGSKPRKIGSLIGKLLGSLFHPHH